MSNENYTNHRAPLIISSLLILPLNLISKNITSTLMADGAPIMLSAIISVISFSLLALFFYGCVRLAKNKGRSGWWGALGIFFLLGVLIIALLKNKRKQAAQ